MSETYQLGKTIETEQPCSSSWEEAYLRFETPEQEIAKFRRRLLRLGAEKWDKNLRVVELFCGRGNALHALSSLGFRNIEGVDLSDALLEKYRGPAKCYVCDCRHLPFDNASRDILIVQGGLHHLPCLPDDLAMTLAEMQRVLRPCGFVVIVEPWLTPFLRFVHMFCASKLARRCWKRIDALATMIANERQTYERWLKSPGLITQLLEARFDRVKLATRWGKLIYIGQPRQG